MRLLERREVTRRRARPSRTQASRNARTGRPMLTNMKLACESVGFMPRSANHFIVKSRTAVLRSRSALTTDAILLHRGEAGGEREDVQRARAGAAVELGHLADRVDVADGVADAQAGHAVGLRESARDEDARVFDGLRDVRRVIRRR